MSETVIQLLMIDDDEDDALLAQKLLSGAHGSRYRVEWAATYHDGLERLCANAHDICLLDYNLGARNGLELLGEARQRQCRVPVIMLTGLGAEEVDRAAMEAGALDYLSKGELTASQLERSIRYGLQQSKTLQALRQAQKDLEQKVEERTAELRLQATALEAAANGIVITDARGAILWANPAFTDMTGYDAGEVVGLNPRILKSDDYGEIFYATMWETILRGKVWRGELVNRRKDGTPYSEEMTIAPVRNERGEISHFVAIKQDITKRKQAEQDLTAANERLAEADRRKDEFLAMLAHELRNPLAPIRNAVQILKTFCTASCAVSEQTARQREMIERQVAHMSRLLDDLLDVSRITRGKIQLRRENLDLRAVAEHAVESMRSQFEGRGQQFAYQSASTPLPIEGDPTRLEQVLRNLLHNAAKYTEPGGCIWMTVGLECEEEQRWWTVVRVRDSGEGIVPELLEHIFEPFVQAEQSLARTQGGLGIGLSMVKSLVELHGGRVVAHSQGLGQGSEFVIRLPLLADKVEKPGVAWPVEPSVQNGKTEKPKRVLVVDDNEDAAASLGELLEIWGQQVRTVHDGRQALAAAHEWRPEIILLDIGLPGMDGYEVARRLRQEPATAGAFLVALTGYGAEEDRQRALEAGFDRHLTKPVDLGRLQSLLHEPLAS